ncbi:MAG: hypothetical protein Q8P05_05385 [Candidatus Diapherotrites archaeon]|nr:hypothetical protein [Candidatus Diapherotrites archaeon]
MSETLTIEIEYTDGTNETLTDIPAANFNSGCSGYRIFDHPAQKKDYYIHAGAVKRITVTRQNDLTPEEKTQNQWVIVPGTPLQ